MQPWLLLSLALDGLMMRHSLKVLDHCIDHRSRTEIMTVAVCGVLVVGGIDYLTGFEVSMSLFYLGPVAVAAWYAGKWGGVAIALLSCLSWYVADWASGSQYSLAAISVWNTIVRFGFFLTTGLLLTELRKSLRGQQYLARTDSLTGLYSRRAFEDRLAHDLSLARRHKSAVTLTYVDVDDFKAVNDTHGHVEGDRVLQVIGKVLKGSVRGTDTAARIGGDEFALILPDTDGSAARQVTLEAHARVSPGP